MTKRSTHEEYEEKLFNKEIDYWPLDKYINAITAIKHICLKNHEFMATPNKILSGRGCPTCAGRISNQQEYKNKLKRTEFINLEHYINDRTNILHKHLVCGYEWKVRPNNIINGKGCPKCSNHVNYTTESYKEKIKNSGCSVLEDFITTRIPINHKHLKCGYIWKVRPDDIIKRSGECCPNCSTSGFNPNKPASLYLVSFLISDIKYYKIGITNRSPKERLANDWHKFNFALLWEIRLDSGELIRNLEREILTTYNNYKFNTKVLNNGNTETFSPDMPLNLLDYYPQNYGKPH